MMFFRVGRRRFRLNRQDTGVKGQAWVLEREGAYSEHDGQRRSRHCRTEIPVNEETLTLMLEQAVKWQDSW